MSSIFFNKIDVVQNVSCHFEQSETTFRSPAKGKGNLAECPGEKGLLGETKVNGAKARSSLGEINLPFVASSANAPRCRRKQRSPPVGAKGNRRQTERIDKLA